MKRLHELKAKEAIIHEEIKEEKNKLNKAIRRDFSKWVMVCHLLFILCVLMNLSCLFMTNYILRYESADAGEEMVVFEASPIAEKLHNLPGAEDRGVDVNKAALLFKGFILQAIYWAFITGLYILSWHRIKNKQEMVWQGVLVTGFFLMILRNFVNDFAYFLSMIL